MLLTPDERPMTNSDDEVEIEAIDADIVSDRAAVISMVALFEDILGNAIRNRLVPLSNVKDDELFGDRGPLATFSFKIDLGYALGVYGHETKARLHLIRKVRNKFAHLHGAKSFDHEEVARLCNSLPPAPFGAADLTGRYSSALAIMAVKIGRNYHVPQRPAPPPVDLP